ncbi:MAG: class I SAM-dependent methyltransferase [Alphaproteobacteria bacterium]|nr:class I SAM-dependent methyltransferase [Alphaproteobacteria bacterium]
MLFGRLLKHVVRAGHLEVVDAGGRTHVFGDGTGSRVAIRLHDSALHRRLFFRPELYLGEAYMDGTLTLERGTLYDLLELFGHNIRHYQSHAVGVLTHRLGRMMRRWRQHNPIGPAQENVAHHYDLKGALYELFLDKDRQYSCAYFQTGNDTLEAAQANKKRHLAAKLLLKPGHTVLDIGSGWGGLGLYLAQVERVDVTGVTLSVEQHKVSNERARGMGLADRVRFELRDYRAEPNTYDRIVSVGMFEHVGAGHYDEFFGKIKTLLKEDGVAVLHSIGRMEPPDGNNPWLRKYIFPGGYSPALSEVLAAIERAGLWVTDIEILRLHYAETLKEWSRRFQANRDKIKALYDERFCRMWEFYLTACEMSFRYFDQMVFQIQLARRQDTVPLVRDYVTDWERSHPQPSAA